ncbi:MAG: hypothetical protein RLY11_968 [Bacteroidota bacterium]
MRFSGKFDGLKFVADEGVVHRLKDYYLLGNVHLHFRDELTDKLGIRHLDAEVISDHRLILMAYNKWGIDACKHLEGEWSFSLFDASRKCLYLTRDPSENCSIFFMVYESCLYFSSGTNYFQEQIPDGLEIDMREFSKASLRLMGTTNGKTMLKDLFYIPPGSYGCFSTALVYRRGKIHEKNKEQLHYKFEKDYLLRFRSLFSNAVLVRMRTIDRVGIFLSSGLDSTSVASFLSTSVGFKKRINAYTSIPYYIDSTDKHELVSEKPLVEEFLERYPNVNGNFFDFPDASWMDCFRKQEHVNLFYPVVHSNTIWINGILEKANADGVELMMTGQMGNYSISFNGLHPCFGISFHSILYYLKYRFFGKYLFQKQQSKYSIMNNRVINDTVRTYFQKDELILGYRYFFSRSTFKKEAFKKLHAFASTCWSLYAQEYNIRVTDPTADFRLVQFLHALPSELYYKNGITKYLLKQSMCEMLPPNIVNNLFPKPQTADLGARLKKEHFLATLVEKLTDRFQNNCFFDCEKLKAVFRELQQTTSKGRQHQLGFHLLFMISMLHFYGKFEKREQGGGEN